jgi:hypothetical protein
MNLDMTPNGMSLDVSVVGEKYSKNLILNRCNKNAEN